MEFIILDKQTTQQIDSFKIVNQFGKDQQTEKPVWIRSGIHSPTSLLPDTFYALTNTIMLQATIDPRNTNKHISNYLVNIDPR